MSQFDVMLVEIRDLKKSYPRGDSKIEILKGISLNISKGEFLSIMGPSGSGKSTLLHLLGGLDRPDSGDVNIEGKPIAKFGDDELSQFRRRHLGFIFQFFNLLPTLTAIENVALPMLLDGKKMAEVEKPARELLAKIGLKGRDDHRPHQLSGGEMQRVAIARALITNPTLLLADEPTGNLDSKTGTSVLELLRLLAKDHGHTLVMVTHDPKASQYGTRVIHIRDGMIESDQKVVDNSPHA